MTESPPVPSTAPRAAYPPSRGYLAATAGGVAGAVLAGGVGVAIGAGLAELYTDPDAGLGNLWVLVFPIGLGALGIVAGLATGVMVVLRRGGHPFVGATAWLTVPFAIVGVVGLPLYGFGLVFLLLVPVIARSVVLRGARGRTAAPVSWPPPRA